MRIRLGNWEIVAVHDSSSTPHLRHKGRSLTRIGHLTDQLNLNVKVVGVRPRLTEAVPMFSFEQKRVAY
jgi:hypothetical protein